MHRHNWAGGLAISTLLLCAPTVVGQIPRQPRPYRPAPTVSPYVNLFRRDVSPIVSYYGIVRPEFQFRQSIRDLNQQLQGAQRTIGQLQNQQGALVTGHQVYFLNGNHPYFGSVGAGGGAGFTGRTATPTTIRRGTVAPPPARRAPGGTRTPLVSEVGRRGG